MMAKLFIILPIFGSISLMRMPDTAVDPSLAWLFTWPGLRSKKSFMAAPPFIQIMIMLL